MQTGNRRSRILRDMNAALGSAWESGRRVEVSPTGPHVGDALVLEGSVVGVEWLVYDRSGDEIRMVPMDTLTLVGSGDLSLEDLIGEPLVARCGFALELPASHLVGTVCVGRNYERAGTPINEYIDRLRGDQSSVARLAGEVDGDSEYRAWCELLQKSRRRALQKYGALREQSVMGSGTSKPDDSTSDGPPVALRLARRRRRLAYALAAGLAVVSIGLAFQVVRLERQLVSQGVPLMLIASHETEIRLGSDDRGDPEVGVTASSDGHVLVVLTFRDLQLLPSYTLRLVDPHDHEVLWQRERIPPVEHVLLLPVGSVRRSVQLEVLGLRADGGVDLLDRRLLVIESVGKPRG